MKISAIFRKQALQGFSPSSMLLLLFLIGLWLLSPCNPVSAGKLRQPIGPVAEGSLPARLFPDGAVCTVDERKPSVCVKRLVRVNRNVLRSHSGTFYGLFDLDADGSPEVFLDYWSPSAKGDADNVVLLVYKKLRGKYRQYLKLKAQSLGYAPGAWFLNERPHPKAIFMTRYGGSSGSGLFYLNLKKRSLDLISGDLFMEGQPHFEDIDGDGTAEIYLPGRGRDRTSNPGSGIFHWNGEGYDLWWPDWPSAPYVMSARLIDLDKDGHKEIAAVLDPDESSDEKQAEGKNSRRELGVWKVLNGKPSLHSKIELPKSMYLSEPYFAESSSSEDPRDIDLSYTVTLGCKYHEGKMVCREFHPPTRE
ncbi:MAG: FG-GAP repeat domain-containing protein [Syntrophobacteraceae bacterium]